MDSKKTVLAKELVEGWRLAVERLESAPEYLSTNREYSAFLFIAHASRRLQTMDARRSTELRLIAESLSPMWQDEHFSEPLFKAALGNVTRILDDVAKGVSRSRST